MEQKRFRNRMKSIFHKWKTDYVRKTVISSLFSLGVTVIFALYNGFLGIRLRSIWHGSICAFYLLLVFVRGIILSAVRKSSERSDSEKMHIRYRAFQLSAMMLLLLNLALICPIALMVTFEKPVNMGMIPAISMAAYTTYKVTMASIHIRTQKSRTNKNILIAELRAINFIDALVSVCKCQ